MKFTAAVLTSFLIGVGAFTTKHSNRGIASRHGVQSQAAALARATPSSCRRNQQHGGSCPCPSCTSCPCSQCRGRTLALFSTAAVETASPEEPASPEGELPTEVAAMDGINSPEEAHNAERPARKSIAKNRPPAGKPLSEFTVGQSVKAKARSIMAYGAFMDFGGESDGLLHISALSTDFVSSVKEFIDTSTEYDVRITSIDLENKKVSLSLLTADEEEQSKAPRPQQNQRGGSRSKENEIVTKLGGAEWDVSKFIEGEVVNTADFGAFVRFDVHDLVDDIEAGSQVDGLVHISCLADRRVGSVSDVVKTGEKVQIRLKAVDNKKISLSMVSVEAEQAKMEMRGGGGGDGDNGYMGSKDWKESLDKLEETMPKFTNIPMIKQL